MKFIFNHPMLKVLFLFNEIINSSIFFNGHYHDQAKTMFVHFSVYAIRLYSTVEIYFNIAKRNSNHFVKKITKVSPILNEFINAPAPKLKNVEFIKSNEVFHSINGTVASCLNSVSLVPFKKDAFDFMACSEFGPNRVVYKKILRDFPKDDSVFKCIPVDYKFLLSEIIVGNRVINTKFTDDLHNYFVDGNEFDSVFINYYLNKYHKTEIAGLQEHDIENFTLKVLDGNVEEKIFSRSNVLKINKENYEVIAR